MKRHFIAVLTLLSLTLLASTGCGGSGIIPGDEIKITLQGASDYTVRMGSALTMTVTGLQPSEFPVVVEVREYDIKSYYKVKSTSRLTADRNGAIGPVILHYDLGLDGMLPYIGHEVRVTSSAGVASAGFIIDPAGDHPMVYACDMQGNVSNAFQSGMPVYVTAKGLNPGELYRIWPVKDARAWNDGTEFKSWKMEVGAGIWPGELPEYIEAAADYAGDIKPIQLVPYATKSFPGITDQFDIVLDAAPFGVFNESTDAVDGELPTGVVVQDPAGGGPIIQQLAARKDYTYTDIFKVGDEVYVWLNPGVIITDPHKQVVKWVVEHQDEWIDGATLTDISAGAEMDVVQPGCVNEGIVLVWPDAEKGEYDVVIDMNLNGTYDEGIDILDWGPTNPGFRVIE
jgi:hypothetical protein